MVKSHQIPIKAELELGVDEPVVDGDGGQPIIDLDFHGHRSASNAGSPVMARPIGSTRTWRFGSTRTLGSSQTADGVWSPSALSRR
jgi:hypothetical protein